MENNKENKHKKTGVIIARFQPVHKGHIALIKKACSENDQVIVYIGSIDKLNKRNPIVWKVRKELLEGALKAEMEHSELEKIKVVELADLSDETQNTHEWGFYLYSNIVEDAGTPYFTIYYSDGFEIITSWFPGWLLRKHVSLSLLARGGCENGVSATAVREAIINDDVVTLKQMVPVNVFNRRKELEAYITIFK